MYPEKFIFNNLSNNEANNILKNNKSSSIVYGIAENTNSNEPISNALITISNTKSLDNIGFTLTGDDGRFSYGPIDDGDNIIVKVWIRKIEIDKI